MKRITIILFLLSLSVVVFSQEEESINILKADDSAWGKEVFKFPLRFASEIPYTGAEEARFPKGWRDTESRDFWSYVFAWQITYQKVMSPEELEENIEIYFNGLMDNKNRMKSDSSISLTNALFIKNSQTRYTGKVRTFDAFTTKKMFTLNVQVQKYDCPQKNKTIVVFRFSPKPFENDVWSYLNEVEIGDDACEN